MATIFRKTYTQHLPKDAEIVERGGKEVVRWVDSRGQVHFDKLTTGRKGEPKITRQSPVYTARFRPADGEVKFVSTGCRDKQAARKVLSDLLEREEKIKAGIFSNVESKMADYARLPLTEHVEEYLLHLKAKGCTEKHRRERKRYLRTLFDDC